MIWGARLLLGTLVGWLILRLAGLSCFAKPGSALPEQKRTHRLLDVASVLIAIGAIGYLAAMGESVWETAIRMVITAFLLLIAVLDFRYQIVPNALIYPAVAVLFLGRLLLFGVGNAMIALCAGAGSFVFFLLVAMLSPGGLGGGDIKLAALVGVLVGFPGVLWALVLAILIGGIAAVVMVATGRRDPMPYAPYLCLGAWVVLIWDPLPWLLEIARVVAG